MLEDTLKVLELFGKLFGYFNSRESSKFKELLEPTFNDLEKVHKNHIDTCLSISALLEKETVTARAIKDQIEISRQEALLMRQRAFAIAEAFADPKQKKFVTYWEFGSAVISYFTYGVGVDIEDEVFIRLDEGLDSEHIARIKTLQSIVPQREPVVSQTIYADLANLIDLAWSASYDAEVLASFEISRNRARRRITEVIIPNLESGWRRILQAYAKLKLQAF